MPAQNLATKRLVEFAQKMYNEHLEITNIEVHSANSITSVLVLFGKHGTVDRYWVEHYDVSDEKTWTWMREDNGA